ncbi:MAG TPA: type 1 glutamine amidotransferase [Solirubrobacterales bacterium]|nr:type 1 glutamine amidotransferase [Solirubrobacterales bacterium]
MRVLAIVQQADAGPGVFAEAIAARGDELDRWALPEGGEPPADPLSYDAVFTLGGSMNVDEEDAHPWLALQKALLSELLAAKLPLLGLCLGAQLVAEAAGAEPRRAPRPEIGWHQVELTEAGAADPLLAPLAPSFEALQWHSYEFPLPDGAVALARSEVCLQACRIGAHAYAVQFHPEVSRADALAWIDEYRSDPDADPDAVRIGIDPAALRSETEAKIDALNELGRALCHRWLDLAADPNP